MDSISKDLLLNIVFYLRNYRDLLNLTRISKKFRDWFRSSSILKKRAIFSKICYDLDDLLKNVKDEWMERKKDPIRHLIYIPCGSGLSFYPQNEALLSYILDKPFYGGIVIESSTADMPKNLDLLHSIKFNAAHKNIKVMIGCLNVLELTYVEKDKWYFFGKNPNLFFSPYLLHFQRFWIKTDDKDQGVDKVVRGILLNYEMREDLIQQFHNTNTYSYQFEKSNFMIENCIWIHTFE